MTDGAAECAEASTALLAGSGLRPRRQAFNSIPELDEALDRRAVDGGDAAYDGPLAALTPSLKPPTVAARSLAHDMTRAMLGSLRDRKSAGGMRRAPSAGSLPADLDGGRGDAALTPRGDESEALARLDYDTSQSFTQFSDAEPRPRGDEAADGLQGLTPPEERRAGDYETAVLSPRDKLAPARSAPLPSLALV